MKLGVISDTHNKAATMSKAFDVFDNENVAMIIHCGDWVKPDAMHFFLTEAMRRHLPVTGVLGNNDREIRDQLLYPNTIQPLVLTLTLYGRAIAVHHGHKKPLLQELISSQAFDAIFTGHTHKIRLERIGKTLVLNPGSTGFTFPGRSNKNLSVAIYDTMDNSAQVVYLA